MAEPRGAKAKKRKRRQGPRTPWHLILSILLSERAPSSFQVRSEVPLGRELTALSFTETKAERGYHRYRGGTFPLVVVEVDRVAEAERDELLGFLGHGTLMSEEARSWLYRVTGFHMGKMEELDEFEDFEAKLIAALGDKVLASMPPEEILGRFAPQQRLAGLDTEELLEGLSDTQKAELLKLLGKQH